MDFFNMFQPPSEEDVERMKAAHERHLMALDEFRHSSQRLFDELDQDQLRTLQTMMHILVDTTGSTMASLWEGIVAATLKHKYNICITCGVNHEEETPMPPSQPAGEKPMNEEQEPSFVGYVIQPRHPDELDDYARKLMRTYHLDDVYDQDTGQFLHFRCTGINGFNQPCGMTHPTIKDRMLKSPEDCSGCYRRMAQG